MVHSGSSPSAHVADATATDTQSELERVCSLLVTYGAIVATAYTPDDEPDRILLTNGEMVTGEIAEVLLDMARTVTSLARMAKAALASSEAPRLQSEPKASAGNPATDEPLPTAVKSDGLCKSERLAALSGEA